MSSGTPPKTVTAKVDPITKEKATALLSFQRKLEVARSPVLSSAADMMKPEDTEHKKVKSYLILMD